MDEKENGLFSMSFEIKFDYQSYSGDFFYVQDN